VGRRLDNANYEGDFELGGSFLCMGFGIDFLLRNLQSFLDNAYFAPAIDINGNPSGLLQQRRVG